MNCAAHYERLIGRARGRLLCGYVERHHVIPRCMGGTDAKDNLVDLTPEEHYVAHQLLVKMYPNKPSLSAAALLMAKGITGRKAYGWLRRKYSAYIGCRMLGNSHTLGMVRGPHTAEHRKKIADALMGHKNNLGHKHSASTKLKQSLANRGKSKSADARAKMSAAKRTPEAIARCRELMGRINARRAGGVP